MTLREFKEQIASIDPALDDYKLLVARDYDFDSFDFIYDVSNTIDKTIIIYS